MSDYPVKYETLTEVDTLHANRSLLEPKPFTDGQDAAERVIPGLRGLAFTQRPEYL